MSIISFLSTALWIVLLLSPVFYILLNCVIPALLGVQDLKKKYNATWPISDKPIPFRTRIISLCSVVDPDLL